MSTTTLLSLRNGDEQVTINFDLVDAINTSPNFTGYHLISYQGQPPPIETARNSSLYVDGSTIVNYKAGNVVETIVLDIVGNSTDDVFDKLRALERFAWSARDYHTAPNSRIPSRIAYIPFGGSRTVYAVVFNAQINETTASGRARVDGNRIRNISVTIEREPYWRQLEPNQGTFAQPYQFVEPGNTSAYRVPRWWGVLSFNATPPDGLLTPGGDVPALIQLALRPRNGFKLARFICGYISQKRNSSLGWTIPTTPNVVEAEGGTIFDSTGNTAKVVVTTASPYVGVSINTAMRIQQSLVYTLRFATSAALGTYTWRLFARMRLVPGAGSTSVSVQAYSDNAGNFGAPAMVNSTVYGDWFMYDMGVMVPPAKSSRWGATPAIGASAIGIATRHITGAESLDIDCFVLIPTDEYYVDMSCTETTDSTVPAMILDNIMVPPLTTGAVNGQLYIPPGDGVFYYLGGWTSLQNSWDPVFSPSQVMTLGLNYTERYISVRGS